MKNPLHKRLPREFFGEFGKYAAIFLFMAATIAFVSGFLVAAKSLQIEYDASFERYNIEDGHLMLDDEPEQKVLDQMEKEEITLYPDYYVEEPATWGDRKKNQATLRLFGDRTEINKVCLLKGNMPETDDEVALDRVYMNNNNIKMNDTIQIAGEEYQICGVVALSDYSVLCQNNNDIMFDATKFGVGVVTNERFAKYDTSHLFYSYAWKYDQKPKGDTEEKEVSDDLGEALAKTAMDGGLEIDVFLPQYINKSIQFAGDDMGSDRPMMICLLYVLIAIMAFVFAVTINHTMAREAAVIGTLRASGYTKGEILRHYLATPMLVAFVAAIVGNILGYTVFVDVAADMYLNSYSLTTFHAYFSSEAFIKTTIVPMIIMLCVTGVALWNKLSLSPLQFLRRNLTRSRRKKAIKLPHFKFFTRFRIRIILQNASSYLTLFVGILFANLILMFGMIMTPLLQGYSEDALKYKPADYQYILKSEKNLDEDVAEKYCVTSLKMQDDYYDEEDISIYGIIEDSKYYDIDLPEEGVVISSDLSKKYSVKEGDIINLREEYGKGIYAFRVEGIYEYPTCLGIFMTQKYYCKVFEEDIIEQVGAMGWFNKALNEVSGAQGEYYFNGYFSDKDLRGTYLSDDDIASVITDDDLTKLSRQMDKSMGSMFGMVKVFAIILFVLLIYLLTKIILEKNSVSISMVKILGYNDSEVAGLYLVASVWVVLVSAVLSLVVNTWLFHFILIIFLKGYGGWFNLKITAGLYAVMFLMMALTYLVVAAAQFFKIKRIPMEEALKNVE
ncbi:MAG: FtsX-like permease family protein [Eubacteriales bacterium]|nr:FtsX-like permease family protein [Eubacteriales bacterium]